MKRSQFPFAWFLPILGLLFFVKCSKIDVEPAKDSTDSSGFTLQAFRILLDSTGKGGFSLDSILKKHPNFSIRFEPISVGTFRVDMTTKRVVFEKNRNDWTIDSTKCEVCVDGACKKSKVVVRNYRFIETNNCDTLPDIGPISVGLLGQVPVTVWPRKSWGKVTEIRPGFYSATVVVSDSNRILFRAVGNSNYYGFDEVGFTVTDSLGKCHMGKIVFAIGDPCEAKAYDDSLVMTGTTGQWPVEQFLANDTSCGGPQEGLLFRISSNIIYSGTLSVFTPKGIITDTTINGIQFLKYRKQNLTATKDEFWYYMYDGSSTKITRAKIRIQFQ
jgi:hypothetical protein